MDLIGLIPSFGNVIFTIAVFIIALSIIVAIHEYGHYIVGRWSGIHAEVFSIGFGPVIYARTDKRGTQWQVAALPLGGYVKFKGDANAASAPGAMLDRCSNARSVDCIRGNVTVARLLHPRPKLGRVRPLMSVLPLRPTLGSQNCNIDGYGECLHESL